MTGDRLRILTADLTSLDVDAIVNAANDLLLPGGGVCGAIHRAAGPDLARACATVAPCPTGDARLTPGFDLRAGHVIHAVGPVWHGGTRGEAERLGACYRRSLELARDAGFETIAFPSISTGIYGYPLEEACRIAVREVERFLAAHDRPTRVILCAFDERAASALEAARGEEPRR